MSEIKKIEKFWDARPCNINHSHLKGDLRYSRDVRRIRYTVEPHNWDFLEPWEWMDKKVLELGCGIGTDTIELANAGAQVVAVDISSESIKVARRRAIAEGCLGNIEFIQDNLEQMRHVPIDDYDLIYSYGAIHHSQYPEVIIMRLKQFMNENTRLKFMVYHTYSLKTLRMALQYGWQEGSINNAVCRDSEAQKNCPYIKTYTKREMNRILKRLGFQHSLWVDFLFPYQLKPYIETPKRLKKKLIYKMMPEACYNWLKAHFGYHLMCEAKLATHKD